MCTGKGDSPEYRLGGISDIVNLRVIWILICVHQRRWKSSPAKCLWVRVWDKITSGPSLFILSIWSCLHPHRLTDLLLPSCFRRDSAWRPSSASVLNTRSLTVACPLAPPWQMCRKSIRSLRNCRSQMRNLCLKKPW